ncbi:MAG: FkbM family methyltransferase, partial [Chloroflexi bacterium]|nr:FkbM family methyltransferase [Chloroflexota bacterium]
MSEPFVSHAQNLEDVMLWRALGDVGAGFYVDVGAFSPTEDSVTLAFSERGWRGIN